MSKVITFSRTFPSYHPRKGEPTLFVEKFYNSIYEKDGDWSKAIDPDGTNRNYVVPDLDERVREPKHHTIRAGHRFKVGDFFSPRVWSGKPYNSKQIIIAPDIEVKKVWYIKIVGYNIYINKVQLMGHKSQEPYVELARNDGLSINDFWGWFPYKKAKDFQGQIICWNENIEY